MVSSQLLRTSSLRMLRAGRLHSQFSLYSFSPVYHPHVRHLSAGPRQPRQVRHTKAMGKNKKSSAPDEQLLHLNRPASHASASIVDTHTHLHSTFSTYRSKYPAGRYETIFDFVRGIYAGRDVDALVDVWCEAPVLKTQWKELADSAIAEEDRRSKWAGTDYWFVMGASASLICLCLDTGIRGQTKR